MLRVRTQHKFYLLAIILLAALAATCIWLSPTDTDSHSVELQPPPKQKDVAADLAPATLNPGKDVVVFETNKGIIEFVLFSDDCPKTSALIVDWVKRGSFNGLKFARKDDSGLVQTAPCAKGVPPPTSECRRGLLHERGSVGIGQWKSPGDASGEVYILQEPWHHLDYNYVVFGRVIKGQENAAKLGPGDVIKKASLRPTTNTDKKELVRLLFKDAEQRVE